METIIPGALLAAGLGALTMVHPCPFATNLAALSFLLGMRRRSLLMALLLVLGEIIAFAFLGVLLATSMQQVPQVARFLQTYMPQLVGPVLVLIGMMLTGLLLPEQAALRVGERLRERLAGAGLAASVLLGMLLALSFCPMSAAMFFGLLLPLAVANNASLLYPICFGLGAGGPLLVLVFLATRARRPMQASWLARRFSSRTASSVWGGLLILLGVFMSLRHIFGVL